MSNSSDPSTPQKFWVSFWEDYHGLVGREGMVHDLVEPRLCWRQWQTYWGMFCCLDISENPFILPAAATVLGTTFPKTWFPRNQWNILFCWWERLIRLPTMMESLIFDTTHHTTWPSLSPSLLQCMYISLNTVFNQEYNGYFTESFCPCLSADKALCTSQKSSPAPVRHRMFACVKLHATPRMSLLQLVCSPPEHLTFPDRRGRGNQVGCGFWERTLKGQSGWRTDMMNGDWSLAWSKTTLGNKLEIQPLKICLHNWFFQ